MPFAQCRIIILYRSSTDMHCNGTTATLIVSGFISPTHYEYNIIQYLTISTTKTIHMNGLCIVTIIIIGNIIIILYMIYDRNQNIVGIKVLAVKHD